MLKFFKDSVEEGSAFTKLAAHAVSVAEAKGRIIALDEAHAAAAKSIAFLQEESTRLHGTADRLKADLQGVLSTL